MTAGFFLAFVYMHNIPQVNLPLDSSHCCGSIVVIESRAVSEYNCYHWTAYNDVLSGLRYSKPQ